MGKLLDKYGELPQFSTIAEQIRIKEQRELDQMDDYDPRTNSIVPIKMYPIGYHRRKALALNRQKKKRKVNVKPIKWLSLV